MHNVEKLGPEDRSLADVEFSGPVRRFTVPLLPLMSLPMPRFPDSPVRVQTELMERHPGLTQTLEVTLNVNFALLGGFLQHGVTLRFGPVQLHLLFWELAQRPLEDSAQVEVRTLMATV